MGIFLQLNETLEWTDERGEEGKGASNIAVVRLVVALVEEEEEEIVSYCSGDDGERERDTRWPRNGCRRFSAIFVPRAGVPFLILCMGYARR